MNDAAESESTIEKSARLRREKADREVAFAKAAEAFELHELELEAKYSQEIGRPGVDWAMVSEARCGVIVVVKLGTDLGFRKYIDAVNTVEGGVDAPDLYAFVAPCVVHPSQEEYAELARARGFIANRCAEALCHLHGTRQKKIDGKF